MTENKHMTLLPMCSTLPLILESSKDFPAKEVFPKFTKHHTLSQS